MTDYQRIAQAIEFINKNFKLQPDLDTVADAICLSPFHFQRLFKEWTGVSPKKFLQFVSLGHAKKLLMRQNSLADTSFETGLSGSSRLHDLFVSIEGMTPGEYKSGGENLKINYSFEDTPFGKVIIASTSKGICHLSFTENEEVDELIEKFPKATFTVKQDKLQEEALKIFHGNISDMKQIKLHLKGTPFQLKVWEALLRIPYGAASTYTSVAHAIQSPTAMRVVGSAIGANPVAYLIPCHRVIRSTGVIGDYHWGNTRKTALLGWENCKTEAALLV